MRNTFSFRNANYNDAPKGEGDIRRTVLREGYVIVSKSEGSPDMTTRQEIENMIYRVALHDRGAFEKLYWAIFAKLFGIILRVLKDRLVTEEVLQ